MLSFSEYSIKLTEASEPLDIMGIIRTYSAASDIIVGDDYVSAIIPTREMLDLVISKLPIDADYDVDVVFDDDTDFANLPIKVVSDGGDEQEDESYEYDGNIDDLGETSSFELIVYTYNAEVTDDEGQELEDDPADDLLGEVKRIIKVDARGKRRVKMKCQKGYKFDGTKCVKISGAELVNKRKAIIKSVRTKRAKGSGYAKRVARLRNRAINKRSAMGLK